MSRYTKGKYKPKFISFNDEMERDLDYIKNNFRTQFRIEPSNTNIMNLLLQTYKETKMDIKRKPKSKKIFMVEF